MIRVLCHCRNCPRCTRVRTSFYNCSNSFLSKPVIIEGGCLYVCRLYGLDRSSYSFNILSVSISPANAEYLKQLLCRQAMTISVVYYGLVFGVYAYVNEYDPVRSLVTMACKRLIIFERTASIYLFISTAKIHRYNRNTQTHD